MSFALGFYEIFSYAIPGFLYILVANGFLQLFKLPHMDLKQTPGTLGFVLLMAIALVPGRASGRPVRLPLVSSLQPGRSR